MAKPDAPSPKAAEPDACGGCAFFRDATEAQIKIGFETGTCRRFPASPPKQRGEWCGEFKRKGAI